MELKLLLIFVLLLLIPFVLGEEIILNFPEEVSFGEEFEAELELVGFEEDLYDVKIDLVDDSGIRIAQIYDGTKFKSTYYYINGALALEGKKTFTLKIIKEYEGRADILVSIRNSKDKVSKFSGYELEVLGSGNEEPIEQEKDEPRVNDEKEIAEPDIKDKEKIDNIQEIKLTNNEPPQEKEVIKLSVKNENRKVYKSKEEYIKEWSIYGFAILLAVIIVLLIIKTRACF